MPATPAGEEANGLLPEAHEQSGCLGNVAESIGSEHRSNRLGCRIGIEDQIDLWLGLFFTGKGVVEQVVKNSPVEPGGLRQIGPQSGGGRRTVSVAGSDCQPDEFCIVIGQPMGLAVIENLQSVFDRSE